MSDEVLDPPKPAVKPKAAKSKPDLLGATVIYTPTQAAADSLRSVRGITNPKWVGIVTLVHEDGTYALHVFRPLGMGAVDIHKCTEGEGPNTFKVR